MLFVVNFFITYFLLLATAKITKKKAVTLRFIIASVLGGAYSLIILADIPSVLSVMSKALAAALIIITAFSFDRAAGFLSTYILFYIMSFAFLGAVYGLALLTKTPYVTMSNGTVYLDISARGLVGSAFLAYIISCFVVRLYNRQLTGGETYTLTVENDGNSVTLKALCDTGNKLREPFSGSPVIIADSERVKGIMNDGGARLIPTSTVSGKAFMTSFKPDRVTVETPRGREEVGNVYVALSDEMKSDGFSAVINPEILSV
ncbi:MAG: sigma-E processing peptidase SpoIIGA [Eubacterium sp.]|nr:sigma-E processing peptidase SpoIIGA [Eubacterium sp.]